MMSEEPSTINELIRNLPMIITAIGVILAAYWSYRAKTQGKANAQAIEVVRTDVNDKMQQFIKVTGAAEHAKGVLEGKGEPVKISTDEVVKVKLVDEEQ